MRRAIALVVSALGVGLSASPVYAQSPAVPKGTVSQDPAATESQELKGQGQFSTAATRPEDAGDALEWDLSFGTLWSTGNSWQLAINGGSNFLLRRGRHQLTASLLGNYGLVRVERESTSSNNPEAEADFERTIGNVQGRVRYDLFLGKRWSLFAMATARHDPFQLLALRLNLDPGAAVYIINKEDERLSVEAGYDFQLDVRTEDAVVLDGAGEPVLDDMMQEIPLEPTRITHAVRLAGAYTNNINEAVSFRTGLEYLQSVQQAQRWRINWDVGLNTQLWKQLSLALTFTLRMDNDPLPGVKSVDTVTAGNLVYRFF